MKFSIIYQFDIPRNKSVGEYLPPKKHLWCQTEGDEQYEYSYLERDWAKGKHRKLYAILSKKEFNSFINSCGLIPEDVETMGSLGAPGFEPFSLVPAIAFRGDDEWSIQSAYVTPIPDIKIKSGISGREASWYRIKKAVLSVWG